MARQSATPGLSISTPLPFTYATPPVINPREDYGILTPSRFDGQKSGAEGGDFEAMIRMPEYKDCFFIYNDNQECYLNQLKYRLRPGKGNGVMRKYQYDKPQRTSGIPTGAGGGYSALTDEVKRIIDNSIDRIIELVNEGRYKRVFYSCGSDNRTIGVEIYGKKMDRRVIDYITNSLRGRFHCFEREVGEARKWAAQEKGRRIVDFWE